MRRALCIRHTLRDLNTDELTPKGIDLAQQIITPLGPFDDVFSAPPNHCTETAKAALGPDTRVFITYSHLVDVVPCPEPMKARAESMGVDHLTLWFRETHPSEVLRLIAAPGEAYLDGVTSASTLYTFATALFILRSTSLEGFARILDPSYSPFNGSHFESCEGFWVAFGDRPHRSDNSIHLLSYVRRR